VKQLKRGVASRYNRSPIVVALALLGACTGGAAVHAETTSEAKPAAGVLFSLDYTLDLQGVARGGLERGTRHLDVLTLSADVDLDSSLGWRGGAAHFDVQNTSGEAPGELTGSLQGVNGAEVSARRLRLYQAWLEQGFAEGRANLRLGFSDLSGNFGVADASGLLLNPSFGMAPDFAASGAAAFPSTALAARRTPAAEPRRNDICPGRCGQRPPGRTRRRRRGRPFVRRWRSPGGRGRLDRSRQGRGRLLAAHAAPGRSL
jgi:carbohydrate-selective porin OprB